MRLFLLTTAFALACQSHNGNAAETYFCHWRNMDAIIIDRGKVSKESDKEFSSTFEITLQGNTAFNGNAGDTGKVVRGRDFVSIETPLKLNSDFVQDGVDVTTIFVGAPMGGGEFFAIEARHSSTKDGAIASTLSGKCFLR